MTSISAGDIYSCGVSTTHIGYCWGSNWVGRLGDGTEESRLVPTTVSGGYSWLEIETGSGVTCGVETSGPAHCWGAGGVGALGNGANVDSLVPTSLAGSLNLKAIDGGDGGGCGVTQLGLTYCWGYGANGENGNGLTTDSNVPVAVLTLAADTSTTSMSVTVDPVFQFTVTPHSGSCNGVNQNGSNVSGTQISFNSVNNTNAIGAQRLAAESNAAQGFTVYVRASGPLSSTDHTIANVSGTNAAPGAFATVGDEGFGYSTSDASLGTGAPDRFTSDGAKWSAFRTQNDEVLYGGAGVASESSCLAAQVRTASATTSGNYTTTLTYLAVPLF